MNEIMNADKHADKKLYIETYGCQMNVADSEVVASIMEMDGYTLTDQEKDADAIFVNTCSIRENAEQKVIQRLALLPVAETQDEKLIIGVLGCMAERAKSDLIDNHSCRPRGGSRCLPRLANLVGAPSRAKRR